MNIKEKSQTEIDLLTIERSVEKATLSLAAASTALNNAYNSIWELPDDRLLNVLQWLVNEQKLQPLLNLHYATGTAINTILDNVGYDKVRVVTVVGRQFTVDEFGTVALIQDPPITVYPEFTSSLEWVGNVGQELVITLEATNTVLYEITNAPAWLTQNGNILSGTPTQEGQFLFDVEAFSFDAASSGPQTITLNITA